ncbi:hypothetical protein [Nocardia crassostreae]|uniref:hypothetical protein n=1 Tax=Nocardia crassostreae TaxID=53428 RepID=UPI000836D942|nr:hypothetical protein [Nocardia crassostreae]
MQIRKFAATALLSIGAMAITGGTVYAAPAEQGIDFAINRSEDGRELKVELTGGTFALTEDAVTIADATGAVVSSLPLAVEHEGYVVSMRPRLANGGVTLVAEPQVQPVGQWLPTSPRSRSTQIGMGIGATLGLIGGFVVGLVIAVATMGIGVLAIPFTGLIGALIGGAIGAGAGGAIPNDDRQGGWYYQWDCQRFGNYEYCH